MRTSLSLDGDNMIIVRMTNSEAAKLRAYLEGDRNEQTRFDLYNQLGRALSAKHGKEVPV